MLTTNEDVNFSQARVDAERLQLRNGQWVLLINLLPRFELNY